MGYIYEIRNIENDKCYVGSTSNLKKRWYEHKYSLKNGNHHSILLQRAWDKYGESSFVWNVLLECSNNELIQREQEYLDLGTEYNVLKTADRPTGRKHSEKTKQQISEKLKGRKLSDEHIENMKGKQINKFVSDETKEKISVANKGKVRSEEYKKQSSESRMGSIPWNKDKKDSQQAWNKGTKGLVTMSEETKEKMALSNRSRTKIEMYDLLGNLLKTFNTIKEALEFIGGKRPGLYLALKENRAYKKHKWKTIE